MSLFPDDYPNPTSTPTWEPTVHCCERWSEFVAERPDPGLLWTVLHAWAHGRVPFSVTALSGFTEAPERRAGEAIRWAATNGWITQAPVERYMPAVTTVLWQGLLPRHHR